MTTQTNGVRRVWLNAGVASEFFPASARMFFQSTVDCDVYGSSNPAAGSEAIGSVAAGTASAIETGYGYISLVSVSSGECAVSYVSAGAASSGGGGGGGGGDATAANQVTQIVRLTSISTTQGNGGDSPAASDTATASEVAIAKRHNVLLSALMATPSDIVLDSAGVAFSPASCSHAYGYTDGNLTTDTATNGAVVRVKTLAYTSGNLTSETKWVVQ